MKYECTDLTDVWSIDEYSVVRQALIFSLNIDSRREDICFSFFHLLLYLHFLLYSIQFHNNRGLICMYLNEYKWMEECTWQNVLNIVILLQMEIITIMVFIPESWTIFDILRLYKIYAFLPILWNLNYSHKTRKILNFNECLWLYKKKWWILYRRQLLHVLNEMTIPKFYCLVWIYFFSDYYPSFLTTL